MNKSVLFFSVGITILFICQTVFSQQFFTVNGFVYNTETREPVSNANIVLTNTQTGTSSDSDGYFELRLTSGKYSIRITSVGFSEKEMTIRVVDEAPELLRIGLMPAKLEIEGIDVFGSYFLPGRDTSVNRIPASILPAMTTISAVEIEKQGAVTLVDALKFVPGGWTETRGRKTKQFFSVRGQKYPYPDYSIDGVWQKEFEETGYFLSALDIESVEIVRSSSALVKGLSGLTGVVDVKTKKPERETISLLAKYGELNNYVRSLQYGNKINDFSFNTSTAFFGTDGPPGRNGKERIGNFHGNLDWKINSKFKLFAGATYISGLRQLVMIDEEIGAPNIKNRREKYDPVRTLLTYVKLNYTGNDGSLTELQTNMAYRNVDFSNYNIPQETKEWHDENDWEYGLNVLHNRPLGPTNTLRIGALYNHWVAPDGKGFYVGRSSNVHTFSGVVASEQKVGKFMFDAGFRLIGGHIVEWGGFSIEGSGGAFREVEPIEDEAAPVEWQSVLGASYVLSGASSLHYNFSGGTIAPRKGSLTSEGESPENEGRFQHDLGFRYKSPNRSEISVSTFFTQRKNSIDFSGQTIVTEDDLVMELYENTDKRSYGVEMSAKLNVPSLHSYVFGNALLMKGEKESDGSMIKDEQLPQVILNTGFYFDYSGFDANVFINYTGPYSNNRFVNSAWIQEHGNFPLGDFVSVDLTTGYTFSGRFTARFFVEVKNILDQKYMTVAGYPDPGRLFLAGVKISNLPN
jgi:iron complex outermembrane receptor protein